jgi:chromosome segregation ATPase
LRGVAPRPVLSDEEADQERESRTRLRAIDARLRTLQTKRNDLIVQMRRLSAEQKALYDRRQAPQEEVQRLYDEHGELGQRIAALRSQRDAARRELEASVVALRELKLTFAPGERLRPDQIRREIAELEHRQQTRALPLDEENALIAHLRQRYRDLKTAEAQSAVVASHEEQRKAAEARIAAARADLERLGKEAVDTRARRDTKMAEVRAKLVDAGGLVAELRAKGRARADVMAEVDAVSREMNELDREGRRIFGEMRARRDEARRTVRQYAPTRSRPAPSLADANADAQLQELLKRGKITLGG